VALLDYQSSTEVKPVSPTANAIHWFSAGLIGFARGWNDTPKIAALALIVVPSKMSLPFTIVAIAMAIGGLISARKVLDTLARKLTPFPSRIAHRQPHHRRPGLPGLMERPASLDHARLHRRDHWRGPEKQSQKVKWKKVTEILLSWIVTLPAAAILAAVANS